LRLARAGIWPFRPDRGAGGCCREKLALTPFDIFGVFDSCPTTSDDRTGMYRFFYLSVYIFYPSGTFLSSYPHNPSSSSTEQKNIIDLVDHTCKKRSNSFDRKKTYEAGRMKPVSVFLIVCALACFLASDGKLTSIQFKLQRFLDHLVPTPDLQLMASRSEKMLMLIISACPMMS
jgi:hypothetical protein